MFHLSVDSKAGAEKLLYGPESKYLRFFQPYDLCRDYLTLCSLSSHSPSAFLKPTGIIFPCAPSFFSVSFPFLSFHLFFSFYFSFSAGAIPLCISWLWRPGELMFLGPRDCNNQRDSFWLTTTPRALHGQSTEIHPYSF